MNATVKLQKIYHYRFAQRGMAEFNWSGENKWWIYSVVMDRDVQWKINERYNRNTHRERERERERMCTRVDQNQWVDVGCIATL